MDQNEANPALSFRKRLFGYDPVEVDAYLAKAVETHEVVRAEVERLRAAEPLARVGGDVANLLTMFAETVSSMRDEAATEIDRMRSEATEYAELQRSEADEYAARQRAQAEQVLNEARDRARDDADALLNDARHELASVATRWTAIERALDEAAGGVASALAAVQRFSSFSGGELIDIADHRTIRQAVPTNEPVAEPVAEPVSEPLAGPVEGTVPEASTVTGSTDAGEDDDESDTVLPSLAAKMWQSRQSQPSGSGARLQYLLPHSGAGQQDD